MGVQKIVNQEVTKTVEVPQIQIVDRIVEVPQIQEITREVMGSIEYVDVYENQKTSIQQPTYQQPSTFRQPVVQPTYQQQSTSYPQTSYQQQSTYPQTSYRQQSTYRQSPV